MSSRAGLESERDFLLRSLDDLEVEREAGNIDDGTYRELRDDYTARAAATIRSLDTGADLTTPAPAPAPRLVRGLTVAGIIAFALVAAVLLTHAVGQRRAGQTITGNGQVQGPGTNADLDSGRLLADAAKRQPKSYAARIAYARYLLEKLEYADAIHEFGAAARLDPSQPEPPTYAGWAGALLAQEVKDPQTQRPLLAASLERINEVIQAHPKYPDAFALKGVILFRFEGDAKQSIPAFQKFLVLTDSSNPIRAQVLEALARAEKAAGGSK